MFQHLADDGRGERRHLIAGFIDDILTACYARTSSRADDADLRH
ncbi:hypothetical protein [Streptomyces sp. NPDC127098]